jgi:HAD superfamily hydrolase (TIGR01509 family)
VILDVDGTLVLSTDAHARAWAQAFAEYDHDISFERIRPLIGLSDDRLVAQLVPGLSDEDGDGQAVAARRKEIFLARYAETLQPSPGSRALITKLQGDELKLVVASAADDDELGALLLAAHLDDLLRAALRIPTRLPDATAVACKRLGQSPSEVLMLGDTPYDIEAAASAGVKTIALRCGGTPDDRLRGAVAVYDDPADLLARYGESPLAAPAPGLVRY